MKRLFLVLLALLGLFGCGEEYGTHYAVGIDPSLSQDQQAAVVDALGEWERMTGVSFDPSIQRCYGEDVDSLVCVHASDRATVTAMARADGHEGHTLGYTKRRGWRDAADVYLPTDDPIVDPTEVVPNEDQWARFRQDAGHELGHSMGLGHTEPGTIMCLYLNTCAAGAVTCEDANQYRALRGFAQEPCEATAEVKP